MICEGKDSQRENHAGSSRSQRPGRTGVTLALVVLCVAVSACSNVQCLVTTPSTDGEVNQQMKTVDILSSSIEVKLNKTRALNCPAESASGADSNKPDNGQSE